VLALTTQQRLFSIHKSYYYSAGSRPRLKARDCTGRSRSSSAREAF